MVRRRFRACYQLIRPRLWPSRPILEQIVATTDPATSEVTDSAAIPTCLYCGGTVFFNVRESAGFVFAPNAEQSRCP